MTYRDSFVKRQNSVCFGSLKHCRGVSPCYALSLVVSLFVVAKPACAQEPFVPFEGDPSITVPSQFEAQIDPNSLATPLEREILPYAITAPKGELIYSIDPKTAYKGLPRGTIDIEPMDEVQAYALPSTLPTAIVVPAASREYYVEMKRMEKEGPKLAGEDKIFRQIRLDQERERCLFYGEECSPVELLEPVQ